MKYFILIGTCFFASFTSIQPTMAQNEHSIRTFVEQYFSRLLVYSSNSSNANSNEQTLTAMHYDPDDDYPNDLDENLISFTSYLINIKENYSHKIIMEYKIKAISPCKKEQKFDYTAVFVTKTLTIPSGRKKQIELLVFVTTSIDYGMKIHNVLWLDAKNMEESRCISNEGLTKDMLLAPTLEKFNELRKSGDESFAIGNYRIAKDFYERAFNLKTDDYLEKQIKVCSSRILCKTDLELADNFSQKKEYKRSIEILNIVYKNCQEYKNEAMTKITMCSELLKKQNYQHFLKLADDLYKDHLYLNAKKAYLKALEYSNNDDYVKTQIKSCEEQGLRFAQEEIARAVYLAENKKYAEAFLIFHSYEASNLLDGDNYYFMAMVLDGDDGKVGKHLNLSRKQRFHLAKIYCIKAMDKGSKEAENMYYEIFNEKSRNQR